MKITKKIITPFLVFLSLQLAAQSDCRVLLEEISEEYYGDCRKGLAHNYGEAVGIDSYEGSFRRGLPHGEGKYTWLNGDYYDGQWKNGKRHGKGTYVFSQDGEQVQLTGYWKDDVFVSNKKIPPYTIGHVLNVERYNIRRRADGDMIHVTIKESGMVNASPSNFLFHLDSGASRNIGNAIGYENVAFPATVKITYTMPDKLQQGSILRVRFEVVINEPGEWDITLYH
jgi:hypothetical protein